MLFVSVTSFPPLVRLVLFKSRSMDSLLLLKLILPLARRNPFPFQASPSRQAGSTTISLS